MEPARSAAVPAVALTDEVVRAGFITRRDMIESFATPSFGPTLAGDTSEQVNEMLLELGERDADASTLAVRRAADHRHRRADADGVRVRVWSVLVIAAPGAGPGGRCGAPSPSTWSASAAAGWSTAGRRRRARARLRRLRARSTTPPRSSSRSAGRPPRTCCGRGGLSDVAVPEPARPVRRRRRRACRLGVGQGDPGHLHLVRQRAAAADGVGVGRARHGHHAPADRGLVRQRAGPPAGGDRAWRSRWR